MAAIDVPQCIANGIHADCGTSPQQLTKRGDDLGSLSAVTAWTSHLRSTLYVNNSRPLDDMESHVMAAWEQLRIAKCQTQANRFFHIRCLVCEQCVYGSYGHYDSPGKQKEARATLERFFRIQPSSRAEV